MKKLLSILLAVLVLAGMLTIAASAEEGGLKEACIRVGTKNSQGKYQNLFLTVVEGSSPKYLITDEDGVAYENGATEENYNVKLEYKDGMATVYLKGATLKNNYWNALQIGTGAQGNQKAITDFPCTVIVESDSYIEAGKFNENGKEGSYQGLGFANAGPSVVTGPGKLTVKSLRVYAISATYGATFKDIKMDVHNNYDTTSQVSPRPAIWVNKGDLVFDNAEVTVLAECGPTLWISAKNSGLEENEDGHGTGNIIVKNGSKLDLTNKVSALPGIGIKNGEFKIDNSDVVIHSQSLPFNPKPIMTGVNALGGTKESNAKPYSEKKVSNYVYFICGPDVKLPEETTPPTTTVPPTTQQQVPPTTQQQVPPTTQAAPPTTQAAPSVTEPVDTDTGSGNGATVLVIVLVAIAVLGIGAAVAVVIINKKKGNI